MKKNFIDESLFVNVIAGGNNIYSTLHDAIVLLENNKEEKNIKTLACLRNAMDFYNNMQHQVSQAIMYFNNAFED